MKVIITGGSGLIGHALTADLVRDGHEVIILSRTPQAAAARMPAGVRALGWDGRSAAGWGAEASGADAIVNLAGESIAGEFPFSVRWTEARKQRIRQSRLDAAQAVVEAVKQAKVKPGVVVQASAVGYYGPRGAETFDETGTAGGDFLARLCVEWEASTAELESMVRRVVIRTGVVLSAEGGALPLQALPFKLFAGGPIGSGSQGFPWIHIQDEVKAIRFLIETPEARGVFNLTGPTPASNATFGRALGQALRRPYWIPVPAFVFKLAFGEAATVLLDGQKPLPERLLSLGFDFQFQTPEGALADFYL